MAPASPMPQGHAQTVATQGRWRERDSTPRNRIVAGQRHDHSGGGGNRTSPNRLETSGTNGLERKVSAGGVNLLDSFRCSVDAVNEAELASQGQPGEVTRSSGAHVQC